MRSTKGDSAPPYINFLDDNRPQPLRSSTKRPASVALAAVATLAVTFVLCQPGPFSSWYLLVVERSEPVPLRVVPCSSWSGDPSSDGWTLVDGALRNGPHCMAVVEDTPMAMPCDGSKAQQFLSISVHPKWDPPSIRIQSVATGKCLMAAVTSYTVGPRVLFADCTWPTPGHSLPPSVEYGPQTANALLWSLENSSLRSVYSACCGDIFKTRPVCLAVDTFPTCATLDVASAPWCDTSLAAGARAKALVAKMSLAEKAANMDSENFGVPRFGVPPNVFSEALHGFVGGCGAEHDFGAYVSTGCPTGFPQVISMGATWNRSLWSAVGVAVSDETRGLYSQGAKPSTGWQGSLLLWAPNINPFRDPRWGRGQEVPSEEPLVCAEYAAHYIPGLQGAVAGPDGVTPQYLKTVATAKHFFDYDLEGHGATNRQQVNVNVSARDQAEYFLPPFESAVRRGKTASVMCSYNAVNGVPACMHGDEINGRMRGAWGFDGFVVSDCDALSDGASHRYIVDRFDGKLTTQAQQSLRGGTDLNCGALYGEQAVGAVTDGLLDESELDVALERIYTKAVMLGIVDGLAPRGSGAGFKPNPYAGMGAESVDTPQNRALALDAALQGLVLLKNDGATLPLQMETGGAGNGGGGGGAVVRKLALLGPHANGSLIFLGGPNYHGDDTLVNEFTPVLRARAHLPDAEVVYAPGCVDGVACANTSGFAAATAAAADADAVVLFLGLDQTIENEGHDRSSLELPGQQQALVLAVAAAAKAPVSVVLVNGGPLAIAPLKESSKVGAILEAFMPGQYGAEAIMRVLLGAASPSGLLPVTVYDADFVDRRPITNLDLRAAGGVTYRYFDGTPLWPFGFGLSYAPLSFRGDATATLHTTVATALAKPLCFGVNVSNTGGRAGAGAGAATTGVASDVVVLGFVKSSHPDAPRNGKLCDFARERAVQPGETRTVKLCVGPDALPLVDDAGKTRVLPGEYTVSAGVAGGVGGAGAGSQVGTIVVAA